MKSVVFHKVKLSDGKSDIRSLPYAQLKEALRDSKTIIVGMEMHTDRVMQHYLYQSDAETGELRRYPLRKIDTHYTCMKGYSVLANSSQNYFGPIQLLTTTAPEVPADVLLFSSQDFPAIEALSSHELTEEPLNKELTVKQKACVDALTVILMLRGDRTVDELEQLIRNDAGFVNLIDDLFGIMTHLKRNYYHGAEKAPNLEYEAVCRAFCETHGIEVSSFSELTSIPKSYAALAKLVPLQFILKFHHILKTASEQERERIQNELREAQSNSNPEIQKEAKLTLFFNGMMQPDEKTALFLQLVVQGDQLDASRMLKREPQLLLAHGQVIDYSGRCFEDISAFEYALWAGDKHMWNMMLKHVPEGEDAVTMRAYLFEVYHHLTTEGVSYNYTISVGERAGERVNVSHEQGFNFTPLLTAMKEYIQRAKNSSESEEDLSHFWCTVVGFLQRYLTVCVFNEYSRSDRTFSPGGIPPHFKDPDLPRQMSIYNIHTRRDEPILGRERDSRLSHQLGVDFGIYRGDSHAVQMGTGLRWFDTSAPNTPEELDYFALTTLAEIQKQERLELGRQLQADQSRLSFGR